MSQPIISQQPGPPLDTPQPNTAQQQQHTTVIVNQSTKNVGPRIWSTGICDCFQDMGSCLLGWFCPCILACQVAIDLGESCCIPCCVVGGMLALRTKLRTQHNITGSIMDDSSKLCCCPLCALCQMAREIQVTRASQQL